MAASEEHGTGLAPEVMARVRQIQIRTHRLVSEVLSGAYRSTLRGTGIEFEEVRPYQPGDDTRSIDWNVTARTGEAFIKTYREERQLTLHFLVDTSPTMDFGTRERTKRELAAELCALLSYVAVAAKDQVGLCLFDAEPTLYLPPRQGANHVSRVVREVVAAPRGAATPPEHSRLAGALEHLARLVRRRSLVFVVSDFLDEPRERWQAPLSRLARRHDVIAVRIFDPFEMELPDAGLVRLEPILGRGEVELDTRSRRVRAAWSGAARQRREGLLADLERARVEAIELSTAGDVAEPVIRFFQRRGRRRAAG